MSLPQVAYNEYKFMVTHEQLGYIRDLLDSLHGNTDPFPSGVVDSIYYDNYALNLYQNCLDGEQVKNKFRIRGYGNGQFAQIHFKQKDMFGVRKIKARLAPVKDDPHSAPDWFQLGPPNADENDAFQDIIGYACEFGHLIPVLRVRYFRYRYRVSDYRITLDTRIEVCGFDNGIDTKFDYMLLPHHVLEIKTIAARPYLPLLGIASLPQISFSKFYLGLNLLTTGDYE